MSSKCQECNSHHTRALASRLVHVQATWVTLLWYASVPRPDMLAQLHASGLLQSLLLKYMQAAYARMQTALIQVSLMLPTNPLCKIQNSTAMSHTTQALLDKAQLMLH